MLQKTIKVYNVDNIKCTIIVIILTLRSHVLHKQTLKNESNFKS